MTSFTVLSNFYLAKDALKYSEGRPDLLWGHLFEPGDGSGVRSKNYKKQMTSFTIISQIKKIIKSK